MLLYVCHEIHLVLLSRFFGTFYGQKAEGPPTICQYSPGPYTYIILMIIGNLLENDSVKFNEKLHLSCILMGRLNCCKELQNVFLSSNL